MYPYMQALNKKDKKDRTNGNDIKVGNMFVEPEATTKHVQEPF